MAVLQIVGGGRTISVVVAVEQRDSVAALTPGVIKQTGSRRIDGIEAQQTEIS